MPPLGRALVHVVKAVPLDSASGQYLAACCMFHNLTAAKATSRVTPLVCFRPLGSPRTAGVMVLSGQTTDCVYTVS